MNVQASHGWIQLEQGHYREDRQMDEIQEEHKVGQKVATHCLTNEVLVGLHRAFLFFLEISICCQHLKIEQFHIKTQIPSFS